MPQVTRREWGNVNIILIWLLGILPATVDIAADVMGALHPPMPSAEPERRSLVCVVSSTSGALDEAIDSLLVELFATWPVAVVRGPLRVVHVSVDYSQRSARRTPLPYRCSRRSLGHDQAHLIYLAITSALIYAILRRLEETNKSLENMVATRTAALAASEAESRTSEDKSGCAGL